MFTVAEIDTIFSIGYIGNIQKPHYCQFGKFLKPTGIKMNEKHN